MRCLMLSVHSDVCSQNYYYRVDFFTVNVYQNTSIFFLLSI